MNERAAIDADATGRPVTAFPVVYLSYDEPWAGAGFADLKRVFPEAVHVHGVAGLDACHKAAAEAVPGDWVITVDADTRLWPGFERLRVPGALLTGDYRLDWLARNAVNGLWSGNGCVKLWPKRLIAGMRTHEAAPDGAVSLDHDLGGVEPGVSGQVTLPDRLAETDPGQTAEHAFRAGLREAVFLRRMAGDEAARAGSDWTATEAARLLRVWATVGRHAPFGLWAIHGARLGLLLPEVLDGWDPRRVNDYGWIARFWEERVRPRFRAGGGGWRWDWLAADVEAMGRRLGLPELDATASQRVAEAAWLSPDRTAARRDSVGYRLTRGRPTGAEVAVARELLETAAALDHPAAFLNLGVLHARALLPDADPGRAAWLFRVAAALGDPHAAGRLAALLEARPDLAGGAAARTAADLGEGPLELRLDPGVTLAPGAARHVPDPAEVPEGVVLGYLSRSEVTGRALPLGVRIARRGTPDGPATALRPVVLGLWAAPATAGAALADGARAAAAGGAEPGWATLGRDAPFGDLFVIGCLAAALGADPGAVPGDADGREARIRDLAGALAAATGEPVPVWSAEESRAVKALMRPGPERAHWEAAGGHFRAVGEAVWGRLGR